MITVRKNEERGHADHGWLNTFFTFSFSQYYDPAHMGFRALRVINDDTIAGGGGFDLHPHNDMEIITYVTEGALEHRDDMGNVEVIRAGEVQRTTAGRGIVHSEHNHSQEEQVKLLQIWILPDREGYEPSYDRKSFPFEKRGGKITLIASPPEEENGAVHIRQDARIYSALLEPGNRAEHTIEPGRHAWLHMVRGKARINGEEFAQGDGAAVSGEKTVSLEGIEPADLLVFDLA